MGPFLFFFFGSEIPGAQRRKGVLRRIFASEVRILAHIQRRPVDYTINTYTPCICHQIKLETYMDLEYCT